MNIHTHELGKDKEGKNMAPFHLILYAYEIAALPEVFALLRVDVTSCALPCTEKEWQARQ